MKDSALEIIARHAQDGARLREEFFRAQASDPVSYTHLTLPTILLV